MHLIIFPKHVGVKLLNSASLTQRVQGKIQFYRQGKILFDGVTLQSGQYFGEPSLCTSADMPATCDVVCKEYAEMYLLSQNDLLEVHFGP